MPVEPLTPASWELWIRSTQLHQFVIDESQWLWPILQTLHYFGLCLLIGTVGLFDLRLLGLGRGISPAGLHKFIPLGIAGFGLNLATAILFVFAYPEQYIYNPSFLMLLFFVVIAGINAAAFYLSNTYKEVCDVAAFEQASMKAKLFAAISLSAWISVIICGRLITFFRPPFFH